MTLIDVLLLAPALILLPGLIAEEPDICFKCGEPIDVLDTSAVATAEKGWICGDCNRELDEPYTEAD